MCLGDWFGQPELNTNYLGSIDISGLTYPSGQVSLLKNDQIVATVEADESGSFDISQDYDGGSGYQLLFVSTTTADNGEAADGTLEVPVSFPLSVGLTLPAVDSSVKKDASSEQITYTFPSLTHLIFYIIVALLLLLIIVWLLFTWLNRAKKGS